MTEPTTRPCLRVISVHSLAGGSGCTTISMLLADHFAQQIPALVVELDPRKASVADGLPLLAPAWKEKRTPGAMLRHGPDFYLDLEDTRKALRDDRDLPCLSQIDDSGHGVDPFALAWRVADGSSGAGRVFVAPGTLDFHTCWDRSDFDGFLAVLLEAIIDGHPTPGAVPPEGGWPPFFGTVVLDCGVGSELKLYKLEELLEAAEERGFDLLWTRVIVTTPARHELRSLARFLDKVRKWAGKGSSALLNWHNAVVVLNQCDADLGSMIHMHRRTTRGDLTDTLLNSAATSLGEEILGGGVIHLQPNQRWFNGGPIQSAGFHEISSVAKAILERAPWPAQPAPAEQEPPMDDHPA